MDISVVIVEYKDLTILNDALLSVYKHLSGIPFQVIVVSNSCYSIAEQREIEAKLKPSLFIFNNENLGFAKAVNQGIRHATGEFIMLMNPDAQLLDDSTLTAINFMRKKSQVACLGPLIIDSNGDIQDSCRDFMTPSLFLKRTFRRITGKSIGAVLEKKDYSVSHPVDWVSGACILASKNAVDEAGLLDERYFMYVEDMDWCRTFHKHGWEVWFLPDWKIEHNAGRGSSGRFNPFNKLLWVHISSYCKYLLKWAFK